MILMNKIEILSRRNTREKILHFLEKEQIKSNSIFFEIPYSRKEMADFLGVDRSALSRELGKLKDDGIIDFEKSTFKFLDRKSTRLNSSHANISYAVFCLKKKKKLTLLY